jgi:hypothetical protein
LFSPVPSHSTFEFFGSMTMQQLLKEPPSSKIGVNVAPRLTVFQTPPNAAATYQVFGFFGSIAMSCTRPVWITGPMLRKVRPLRTSAVSRSVDAAGADVCPVVSDPRVATIAQTAMAAVRVRF